MKFNLVKLFSRRFWHYLWGVGLARQSLPAETWVSLHICHHVWELWECFPLCETFTHPKMRFVFYIFINNVDFDRNFNNEKRDNVKIDIELMIQCIMGTITQARHFTKLHLPENIRLTPPKWNILFFSYGATFLTNSALEEHLFSQTVSYSNMWM